MKSTQLTPKQRELFEKLKDTVGGRLRKHIRPSNIVCYRLLDAEMNPIMNVRCGLVDALIEKDLLDVSGFDFVLKATSGEAEMDISKLGLVKS